MTLETGARLGPYEIISMLGAGGMGEVYKARDPRLDRTVAIKIIRSKDGNLNFLRQRFEHEGRLVAQISHPNVLVLHDFGIHEGAPYMVSEFIEGESLRAMAKNGPLAARRVIEIAREIAEGLAAAHDKGIVHRDLKPDNILIAKSGHAKILDFGIAKLTKQEGTEDLGDAPTSPLDTAPGQLVGTAAYVSPEQVRGGEADSRSDIFALGTIMHEVLSGKRLFARGTTVESLSAILKDDPVELSELGIAIPQGLERIVKRCLEKDPARRFRSAHDLAFALEALEITSFSLPARDSTSSRFNPRLAGLLGVSALVMLAFTFGWRTARKGAHAAGFTFHRLTFQPGATLSGARFAPDGETVVYDGRFGSSLGGVFSTRVGSHEFRSLDLPPGTQVLALSSTGELAIRLPGSPGGGVLARVPLAGGVPRPLLEGVINADWSPDGKDLAVVRNVEGGTRLEYPLGVALAEAKRPTRIGRLRVSPGGDQVAYLEIAPGPNTPGRVVIVDRAGARRVLTDQWFGNLGVAWSQDGREVYFNGTSPLSSTSNPGLPGVQVGPPSIRAVDMAGNVRLVLKAFTELLLRDASQGRLLLTQTVAPNLEMVFFSAAEKPQRDLAWLNWSMPAALSPDGKHVLFDETRTGDGTDLVYFRKTDGSPPVRLGKGNALALSADGAWAATVETRSRISPLVLMPTGAGDSRVLPSDGLGYQDARFFPDGKRLLVRANEVGHGPRLYVLDVAGGRPRPLTVEGVTGLALSPDGKFAATSGPDGRVLSVSTSGGEGVILKGFEPGDQIMEWSDDGRSLFVGRTKDRNFDVYRVAIESGKRELWRSHSPPTPQGRIFAVLITPDGRSSLVSASPAWLELYVADGVR